MSMVSSPSKGQGPYKEPLTWQERNLGPYRRQWDALLCLLWEASAKCEGLPGLLDVHNGASMWTLVYVCSSHVHTESVVACVPIKHVCVSGCACVHGRGGEGSCVHVSVSHAYMSLASLAECWKTAHCPILPSPTGSEEIP